MTVDVILPAGGRIAGEFAAQTGTEVKTLIPIRGTTVLGGTIESVRAAGRAARIIVIGPDEVAAHPDARAADRVLPEGDSGPENIFRGLEWLRSREPAERTLILTTDLPFLTPDAIAGFLAACPPEADVCVPVIRRESFQERFPGSVNEYVPLRDGAWTIGCAFLVNPQALERSRLYIDRAFAARKSQIAMARLLGPLFIARFALRQLAVIDIERRCAQILGCSAAAVHGCAPELAYDIDLPDHYRYAIEHLG